MIQQLTLIKNKKLFLVVFLLSIFNGTGDCPLYRQHI